MPRCSCRGAGSLRRLLRALVLLSVLGCGKTRVAATDAAPVVPTEHGGPFQGVAIRTSPAPRLASADEIRRFGGELGGVGGPLVVGDRVYISTQNGLLRIAGEGSSVTLLPTADPVVGRAALDPVSWTVYVQSGDKVLAVEP